MTSWRELLRDGAESWLRRHYYPKRDHVVTSSGTAQKFLPITLGSDGKLDNSLLNTGSGNGLDADTVDGEHATAFLLASGTRALTGNWDIGSGRTLSAGTLAARSASGIRIQDDAGNLGVFVEDGGDVGIGTTSPSYPLHVSTSDAIISEFERTGATAPGSLSVYRADNAGSTGLTGGGIRSSDHLILIANGASNIAFSVNSAEKMRVASDGNVGIGTKNPTHNLHIEDTGETTTLKVTDGTSIVYLQAGVTGEEARLILDNNASGEKRWDIVSGLTSGALSFLNDDNNVEAMTILSGGNVGIGNTSPDALLTVGDSGGTSGEIQVQSSGGRTAVLEADDTGNFVHVGSISNHNFSLVRNDVAMVNLTSTEVVIRERPLRITGTEGGNASIQIFPDQGDDIADHWAIIGDAAAGELRFWNESTGNEMRLSLTQFTVPNVYTNAQVASNDINVTSVGTIHRVSSSRKYKRDIVNLPDKWGWPFVRQLRPTAFRSSVQNDDPGWRVGLIAEEVAELSGGEESPYVSYGPDGYPEGVRYSSLVTPLILTVQQQAEVIRDLRQRVTALENG